MRHPLPALLVLLSLCLTAFTHADQTASDAGVTKSHAISLYGQPKYPASFSHFGYVNPNAPKGGKVRLMAFGNFDSLNPYTLKNISPFNTPGFFEFGISELAEPLMVGSGDYAPSGDEVRTAYGLLAESIEYPADRSWAIFTLNPNARFHDGSPVTADDVVFSFNTLVKDGHPRFQQKYQQVSQVEKLSPKRIKFSFNAADNRDMPLRAAELPVLSKQDWQGKDFSKGLQQPMLTSGPYRVKAFKPGQYIVFERVKNYWGAQLAVNKGRYNFDEVRFDLYRDLNVAFEAFKAGEYDLHDEHIASNWAKGYDFPALRDGRVSKHAIPHQQPAPLQAFYFNTRRPLFKDIRVRQAIGLMFDYEWLNKSIFSGAYKRTTSYFPNSPFSALGEPKADERALLNPYATKLNPKIYTEAIHFPETRGDGNIRKQKRQALRLLKQAGWRIKNNQLVDQRTNQPFEFELIYDQPSFAKVLTPFQKNLSAIGIKLNLRSIDHAQYKVRRDNYDFDMMIEAMGRTLAPGFELRQFYHSSQANAVGGFNFAGIQHPVVDVLVDKALTSETYDELTTRLRALDRVLLSQHYIIPHWYLDYFRLAYWNKFARPSVTPKYILGFQDWWLNDSNINSKNSTDTTSKD